MLQLCVNTTLWRRMWGTKTNVHVSQTCSHIDIPCSTLGGPPWDKTMCPLQAPNSCPLQSAATANRASAGYEPLANWTYQSLWSDTSQGYTQTATGSCNREISGNCVSEGQMYSSASHSTSGLLNLLCTARNFGKIWPACGNIRFYTQNEELIGARIILRVNLSVYHAQ
jgi:hypothetical protein